MVLLMQLLKTVLFAPLARLGIKQLKPAEYAQTLYAQNAISLVVPLVTTASHVVMGTL